MSRPSSFLLSVIVIAATCGACGKTEAGRGVETWRFAIEETSGSVQDAYAQRFKQLVEERTKGAVRVTVYPYGTLGTSDHILEQLHNGTLELAMSSPGHLGKLIPEVQAFLLHFVLSDDESVNRCALSDARLHRSLDALYAEKGLRFLDVFSEGWMVWTTQKPVREPADFSGMKFRVMTSPLLIAAYKAYGAHPTPLSYGEVYSALQLHMIDGQVNPIFAIQEMSFYEVTDWLVFANHAPFVTTVAGSPELFAALSPDRRRLVEEIIEELDEYISRVQQRFNEERLGVIVEAKPAIRLLRLDESERQRFRAAAAPVRDVYMTLAGRRGAKLLATLEEAVEAARKRCGPTRG